MNKRENYVPVVIIGATVKAVGLASVLGDNALVLERSCLIGSEFIDVFDMKLGKKSKMNMTELKSKILKKKAITEEKVFLPAVSAALFELVKEKNLKFYFKTVILDVEKRENAYLVTYYNVSGISQIWTSYICDTTEIMPGEKKAAVKKYLNIMLIGNADNKNRKLFFDDVILCEGFYSDELILKMEVNVEETWYEARKKFFEFWDREKESFCHWKVAYVASTFQFLLSEKQAKIEENWYWIPSNTGQGVLESFYEGVQMGGKKKLVC